MPPANTTPAQGGQTGESEAEGSGNSEAPLTREEIVGLVHATVRKSVKESVSKTLTASLEEALAPIREKLEAAPPPAPEGDKPPDKTKPAPETVALQKQLDEVKATLKARDEEVAAERKRVREERSYTALCNELQGKVKPEALKDFADLLVARGRLVTTDDGQPLVRIKHSPSRGMAEEDTELPLADGVRELLKSKEASLYVPAPNPGGAGAVGRSSPGRQPPTDQSKPATTPEEAWERTRKQLEDAGISSDF